jgi:outer membrane protein assembly factor BamB
LFAFDRVSGSLAYSIQNPADPHTLSQGTVVVGNQNDALTRTFDGLVSFDLDAQSVRWSLTGEYSGAMAIDDGIVFAANGGQLGLLDEATGNPIDFWSAPAGLTISSNVVVIDNLIFAGTTAGTYAIDRNTLTTVWSTPIAGDLAVGNDLILISNSESLHVFAVPEPAAAQLLVAGSAVLLAALTRRRRSPKSTASPTWSNTSQKKKFAPPASFASKAKPTSCRTATSATSYATKAFLAARPSLALEHRAER